MQMVSTPHLRCPDRTGGPHSLDATIGNMHRFRDGVLAKL